MRKRLFFIALLLVGCDGNDIGSVVNSDTEQTPPTAQSDWTDAIEWNEVVVYDEERGMNEIVVHDDSQFFVATDDGTVFSSFDAFNWTKLATPLEDVDYSGGAWNGTQLILAGGVSWNRHDGTYRPRSPLLADR